MLGALGLETGVEEVALASFMLELILVVVTVGVICLLLFHHV